MKTSVFKKAVALLVCALMLFSTLVISAGAATVATLTVAADGDSYNVGDTVKVTASVSGAGSFQSMGLTIAYDDVLKLVGGGWLAEDAVIADYTVGNAKAAMTFEADTAFSGDVFYLEFVVLEAATFGDYNVTLTPVIKTEAGAVVECAAGTATVTVACAHANGGEVAFDDTYHWTDCGDCGEDLDKAEHSFDNACDATCDCGYVREVGDHVYDNACDADCNNCGAIREVGDHVYDNDCDANCNNCGEVREVGDHTWGDYDYDDDGHWQTCVNGDATTEKTGHTYGDWIVETPADKTTTGLKYKTCVCGHRVEKVIPALLRFQNAALTLSSNIQFNFNVPRACFDSYGYTDAYAIFEYTNKNGTPASVRVDEYRTTSTYYVFDFADFAPDMMGDRVYATLYAKNDGEDYVSATVSYSVLQYCEYQLAYIGGYDAYAEFRTLLVDMLNYGAAVQTYTGYKADALVNANLTATQKSWGTTDYEAFVNEQAQSATISGALLTWKNAALILNDAVTMTVDFYANDLTDLEIDVTCGKNTWTFNIAEELAAEDGVISFVGYESGNGNRYTLKVNELGVINMREPVYFVAKKNGTVVSRQITYSVQSYAYRYSVAYPTYDVDLCDLVIAMMKYGDAVYAYVN